MVNLRSKAAGFETYRNVLMSRSFFPSQILGGHLGILAVSYAFDVRESIEAWELISVKVRTLGSRSTESLEVKNTHD
jgi:hypothetical protein